MKRVGIGDIHLSGYQSDPLDENGLTRRLNLIMKSLDQIASYCHKHSIGVFEIWGDLINDKDLIYTDAQNAFKDFLYRNSDIRFRIISGNHDLSTTSERQTSAISVFDYDNVDVITSVLDDGNITYLPYCHNIFDILKTIEPNDILISHFGINEAMLQSNLSVVTNVKLSDLKKFKLVLLGHYHKPQNIQNVYYSGNICHLSWSDKNEQKRFLVYDDKTLEVESVPITGFTEFREFIIDDIETSEEVLVEAEKAKNQGHIVKIRKLIKEDIETPLDILVVERPPDVDVTDRGIDLSQSTDVKLRNYLRIKEIPDEEYDEYIGILQEYNII